MSAVTPNTELYLLKCPLEVDNQNQMDFASKTAQETYFKSLPKLHLENFTYQRHDSVIRVPYHVDSILEYNYVMYKNKNYSNKWFYAFITKMEYLNDSTTLVTIKEDSWQNWQFDLTWKRCFVEREHVSDDTFGLHVLDEGINPGEYVVNEVTNYTYISSTRYVIAVQVSDLPDEILATSVGNGGTLRNYPRVYNALPNGCYTLCFCDPGTGSTYSIENMYEDLSHFIEWMTGVNKIDAIVSMFVIPCALIPSFDTIKRDPRYFKSVSTLQTGKTWSTQFLVMPATTFAVSIQSYTWTRNSTINGYTPHNNKCYCWPFNYLMISNNGGSDIAYHWEDFDPSGAQFTAKGIVNQGCDVKLYPTLYKNAANTSCYPWSMNGQKLPTLSWNSDYYLNWLAQNGWDSVTQSIDRMGNRGQVFLAENEKSKTGESNALGALGDFVSAFGGYVGSLFNAVSNVVTGADYQASIVPDASKGNINSGDINFTLDKTCFTGYKMSCKASMIKIVDDFFDRFGYKVARTKVPELHSRTNWNYVKCTEVNVIADIPQAALDEIKSMFRNGVTLWHNSTTYMDYSQSNTIIS